MIIMGLEEEYSRAYEHIKGVDWTKSKDPSKTFETNIRYLGGLLSAYDLKGEEFLLEKAIELADTVIMPAFDTPKRMPAAFVDVNTQVHIYNLLSDYINLSYFIAENLFKQIVLFWLNLALFN